jgi:hypothetical protein
VPLSRRCIWGRLQENTYIGCSINMEHWTKSTFKCTL